MAAAASTAQEDPCLLVQDTLKLVIKTIDNVSYDFEVPKTLQVHELKERLRVCVLTFQFTFLCHFDRSFFCLLTYVYMYTCTS